MADNNDNNAGVSYAKDTYQAIVENAEKTYSPVTQSRNYQPVIPAAVGSQRPTPPVGASGVPSAKNGEAGGATPSAKNSSS
jgi:hypothetical protein